MIEGLLWLDADPKRPLAVKVQRAAARYQQKFTRRPDVCYVHPTTLNGGPGEVDGIRLLADPKVQPGYFWIGEDAGVILHGQNGNGAEPAPASAAEPVPRDGGTVAEAEPGPGLAPLSHIDRWICRNPGCDYIGLQPEDTCPMCGWDGRE